MADIIKWANQEGYTLKLTTEEVEELLRLLKQSENSYWQSLESNHFIIENDD